VTSAHGLKCRAFTPVAVGSLPLRTGRLGPQLPMIRDWTERHLDFTGYVTGFDPAVLRDRSKLRDDLG
jgi:hypothetical protein